MSTRCHALPSVLAGLIVGVPLAAAFAQALSTTLFRAERPAAWTFVAAAALLSGTAWLACQGPARRAASTDPAVVLRGNP